MRLFSYVVAHDAGFAPNPFWGVCSLATCKPGIRLQARAGDWVIGTGSKKTVGANKLVYAMKITRPPMLLEEYGQDDEFKAKIPEQHSNNPQKRCGDNIYYLDKAGHFCVRPNDYHFCPEQKQRDLRGKYVLLSDHFYYFGKDAIPIDDIDDNFMELVKKGPSYKTRFPPDLVDRFLAWLESKYSQGRHGQPYEFDSPGCGCKRRPGTQKDLASMA